MQLCDGPSEQSARCSSAEHAPLSEISESGMKAARHLESHWRDLHNFIFRFKFFGRPLRPSTSREGTRPEITLNSGKITLNSGETPLKLPSFGTPRSQSRQASTRVGKGLDNILIKSEPQTVPREGSLAVVATTPARAFPTEQRVRQRERKKQDHAAKRRPQVVEDHHDDCGEDPLHSATTSSTPCSRTSVTRTTHILLMIQTTLFQSIGT